jgi:hypothetical protein
VVRELDVTRQALRDECREAEQLRECISVMETALDAAGREAAVAKAATAAAQVELTGNLDIIFSRVR